MRRPIIIATTASMLFGMTACGSPATKAVRTTTTTVDDNGNSTAQAHSELRSNVPVVKRTERYTSANPVSGDSSTSSTTTVSSPDGSQQTIEQSQSTNVNGTTTVEKQTTNY